MILELDRKGLFTFLETDYNKSGHRKTAVRVYIRATYYLTLRKIKENCLILVLSSSYYVMPVVLPEDTVT
jgi:hypothetical protein